MGCKEIKRIGRKGLIRNPTYIDMLHFQDMANQIFALVKIVTAVHSLLLTMGATVMEMQ
jgi:hypothetical protein